ncbi:MAG: tRNA (adenosine(37)-N6)-threonylcarbamoyltransferase complex dimerization subunit type 1 TsaB [Verrucomicrobiae bacterium]|nr:tRNA (adenosine(37)-N6)-threonylcarbamoyltransferase complex dimerization subunit type 1 TsaB [Verrucomicrobiae bacterium]
MILAIESSTPRASLALYDRETSAVVWSREFVSERAHNAMIFEPLEEGLERCRRQLDLIIIGRGPGSYGGVRVGIAVANGLSVALGAPVIGLSSLEALSADVATYAVIGDARRQSFFVARIREGALEAEPDLVTQQGLIDDLTLLDRSGIPVFTSDPALAAAHPGITHAVPDAALLARRAATFDPDSVARLASEPLEPHYLRAPYITTPK